MVSHSYPPNKKYARIHNMLMKNLMSVVESAQMQLRIIVQRIAVDNSIVVMFCNKGHREMLMNFACSAQSRNLSISQVLVFAADNETSALAEGLGMAAWHDEEVRIPALVLCCWD